MDSVSTTGASPVRWRNTAIALFSVATSAVAGITVLALVYGLAPVAAALLQANRTLLLMAAGISVVMLTVRARRAAVLLSHRSPVHLSDTYSAMVVGNGIGDLVPVVPCGVALRCFLTERLSSISVAYSAGVFMLEGVLDGLGLASVSGILLIAMQLPAWVRVLLLASLIQSLLSLAVPVSLQLLRRSHRLSALPGWFTRLIARGGSLGDGLVSGLSGGRRGVPAIGGLSLLIIALAGVQLVLFLSAFGLSTSPGNVLLILVLTLAAGNLPINLPGSGTVSTAAALQVAGIHGAGIAGFVLMSRFVLSSEVTLLALGSLAWWGVTGRVRDLRVGAAFQSLCQTTWSVATCRGQLVGRRLGHNFSESMKRPHRLAAMSPRLRVDQHT